MNQPAAQVSARPQGDTPIQMRPTTYFVALALPSEANIAIAYLKKKYPESPAKRVTELYVDRLIPGMHVITLMRRDQPSPPVTYVNSGGIKEPIYHKAEEFADEVSESEPIAIAKYFNKASVSGDWALNEGVLDKDRFFDDLAKTVAGATIKWNPTALPGIMKLDFI